MDKSEYCAAAAPEFDAACILIQLSGDSHSSTTGGGGREEESVGDTTESGGDAVVAVNIDSDRLSASSYPDAYGCGEIEVYPLRRKRRFRSVSELYAITKKSRKKSCPYVFQ